MLHAKLVKEIQRCRSLLKDGVELGRQEWVRQGKPVEDYLLQPLHPVLQSVHNRLNFAYNAEQSKDENLMTLALKSLQSIEGGWSMMKGTKQ